MKKNDVKFAQLLNYLYENCTDCNGTFYGDAFEYMKKAITEYYDKYKSIIRKDVNGFVASDEQVADVIERISLFMSEYKKIQDYPLLNREQEIADTFLTLGSECLSHKLKEAKIEVDDVQKTRSNNGRPAKKEVTIKRGCLKNPISSNKRPLSYSSICANEPTVPIGEFSYEDKWESPRKQHKFSCSIGIHTGRLFISYSSFTQNHPKYLATYMLPGRWDAMINDKSSGRFRKFDKSDIFFLSDLITVSRFDPEHSRKNPETDHDNFWDEMLDHGLITDDERKIGGFYFGGKAPAPHSHYYDSRISVFRNKANASVAIGIGDLSRYLHDLRTAVKENPETMGDVNKSYPEPNDSADMLLQNDMFMPYRDVAVNEDAYFDERAISVLYTGLWETLMRYQHKCENQYLLEDTIKKLAALLKIIKGNIDESGGGENIN